jgi:hypothetical protein
MSTKKIALKEILLDASTQIRATTRKEVIAEYKDAMKAGAKFPPVVLFHSEEGYHVGDGFHRILAARQAKRRKIRAEVHEGGQREALLHACCANATHGIRRTNAEKRKAVRTLLGDPEWAQWSNREIARRAGVSDPFVGTIQKELRSGTLSANRLQIEQGAKNENFKTGAANAPKTRRTRRGDSEYFMDVENIGREGAPNEQNEASKSDEDSRTKKASEVPPEELKKPPLEEVKSDKPEVVLEPGLDPAPQPKPKSERPRLEVLIERLIKALEGSSESARWETIEALAQGLDIEIIRADLVEHTTEESGLRKLELDAPDWALWRELVQERVGQGSPTDEAEEAALKDIYSALKFENMVSIGADKSPIPVLRAERPSLDVSRAWWRSLRYIYAEQLSPTNVDRWRKCASIYISRLRKGGDIGVAIEEAEDVWTKWPCPSTAVTEVVELEPSHDEAGLPQEVHEKLCDNGWPLSRIGELETWWQEGNRWVTVSPEHIVVDRANGKRDSVLSSAP